MRRGFAAAAVVLAVTGCAAGEDGQADNGQMTADDYYQTMRDLPGFEDFTDAELDDIADRTCELVDTAVEMGESNDEAVERVYQTFIEAGYSEPDALSGSIALIGYNCPIDITQ